MLLSYLNISIHSSSLPLSPPPLSLSIHPFSFSPGYKVTKIRDPTSRQVGLLFQIQYPEIDTEITTKPRHRFMSAYEQRMEDPQNNRSFQYLIFACAPYETIAFKINSHEVDNRDHGARMLCYWDVEAKQYNLQFMYRR